MEKIQKPISFFHQKIIQRKNTNQSFKRKNNNLIPKYFNKTASTLNKEEQLNFAKQ
jgi:hypothetical protein